MPGGLLNIVAYGNQNIILNGNPKKTFFKTVYAKYTNFGIQKFRIDYQGASTLNEETDTVFKFNIPRNAELLLDSYLVCTLPDIYSPILPPSSKGDLWKPYHFKWVQNFGTSLIKHVRFLVGSQVIQEYPGDYIHCVVQRDFSESRRKMFDIMSGNVVELHSPEMFGGNRMNNYPNVFYNPALSGSEPSIRGRKIYVPLNPWFMNDTKMAFPLVCLQYSELQIEVTLRPIKELFTINSVDAVDVIPNNVANDPDNFNVFESAGASYSYLLDYKSNQKKLYIRKKPNFSDERQQMYNFLQQPPTIELTLDDYENKVNNWDQDIHLITNMCFLTSEEANTFALNEQKMLIKDVKHTTIYNVHGSQKFKIDTNALTAGWMWFYRRSDVYERNEWSNYTNWKTTTIPYALNESPNVVPYSPDGSQDQIGPGADYNVIDPGNKITTNHRLTPDFSAEYRRKVLVNFAIVLDGKYREEPLDAGIYDYIEKYRASKGYSDLGIYNYNFCLDTSPHNLQPNGAINLSRFKSVEMEMTTITPPLDNDSKVIVHCDGDGNIIGVSEGDNIYQYSFEMHLFEERYNILRFISGNAGLLFAR